MSDQKTHLKDSLLSFLGEGSQVHIQWVSSKTIDVLAVSDKFRGLNTNERTQLIKNWLNESHIQAELSLASLYTLNEAKVLGIEVQSDVISQDRPYSWFELIEWAHQQKKVNKTSKEARVVAFYSYKGGVGRTTALVHVAWLLASRGKKVVMVDLDFEAPSLHQVVGKMILEPKLGLVDYLYERMNIIENESPRIKISDIIGEISVPTGSLFVIPAGYVNEDYIAKVDDLRNLPIYSHDLWDQFIHETEVQLQPDLILVDSRTGINIWGALSILAIADESIIFMNPNSQNREGIKAVVTSMRAVGLNPHIVLSPVLGKSGQERALMEWRKLMNSVQLENTEELDEWDEPIQIPYATEIALSDDYPYRPLLSLYYDIVNLLDEETEEHKLTQILTGQERWKVIESLEFSPVDAKMETNPVRELFQKTQDFDRFLDLMTVLVKGKKGTGKTQLYWAMLKHFNVIQSLAGNRLDYVTPISAHGPADIYLERTDFEYINNELKKYGIPWESFWRAYALFRIFHTKELNVKGTMFKSMKRWREIVPQIRKLPLDRWDTECTKTLLHMIIDQELRLSARDLLQKLNDFFATQNRRIWLLYDNLDENIPEYSIFQKDALAGLFLFVQSLDGLGVQNIRPKVFLRTDIWHRLNFTNKSHFIGRDVELKWSRDDFLRLAFRQAKRSQEFSDLVARFSPVSDIDQAPIELVEKALELLWGINRERGKRSKKVSRWIWERLTDASGNTFPRALIVLLNGAKEKELEYKRMIHISAPTDRLLRTQSLNEGLRKASEARCGELREEYKELDDLGFFAFLKNIPQIVEQARLNEWWEENAKDMYVNFEDFLEQINQIGLAAPYDDNRWRFADLYVHGFKMSRSGKI